VETQNYSLSMGLDKLQVEGDSKLIIEVALGRSTNGWKLKDITDDITCLLSGFKQIDIGNINHEGNRVVDGLANLGQSLDKWRCWKSKYNLPIQIQTLLKRS